MLSIKKILFLGPYILWSTMSFAQDAWLFNEYKGLKEKKIDKAEAKHHYVKQSALYQLDINEDNRREYFNSKIVDGVPELIIYDSNKEKIFTHKFPISGFDAHLYRIRRRKLSENKLIILFYLFNGKTSYIEKFGSSSLWGIVVENKKLNNLKIINLGNIWTENTDNYGHYKRAHQVEFQDVNEDGQLDLVIYSGSVYKAYSHVEGVKWHTL